MKANLKLGLLIIGIVILGLGLVLALRAPKSSVSQGKAITEQAVPAQETIEAQTSVPLPKLEEAKPPAEQALGEIESLIRQLDNLDFRVSQEAAEELAGLGSKAVPALLAALPDASLRLKGQIVFLLGQIGDNQALPALLGLQKDENSYIRRNATEALGKIKDERALAGLSATLFDEDTTVRQRAAWALGELKDPRAANDLINKLRDEKEEMVRGEIVHTLGKLKSDIATDVLIPELNAPLISLYANKVVQALGEIRDPKALPALEERLGRLLKNKPDEPELIFHWQIAVDTLKEAIAKIQAGSEK